MTHKPLVLVHLFNKSLVDERLLDTLDLDDTCPMGEFLLDRLKSFGYERFHIHLVFIEDDSPQSRDQKETWHARAGGLAARHGASFSFNAFRRDVFLRPRTALEINLFLSENLNVGATEPFLSLLTSAIFAPREALERVLLESESSRRASWSRAPWEYAQTAFKEYLRMIADGTDTQCPGKANHDPCPGTRFFERSERNFGVRLEFKDFFEKLVARCPPTVWSYAHIEEIFKESPEMFRGLPKHCGVELTNDDNLPNRLRAPRRVSTRPTSYLSDENWADFLAGMPPPGVTLSSLDFWDFGEPLLHPRALEMISEAAKRDIRVDLYTNGLLLDNPEKIEQLLESGLDAIFYRLDAATPETYGIVSGDAALHQTAVGNLRALLDSRKTRLKAGRPPGPTVALQITEMPETAGDVGLFFDTYDHRSRIVEKLKASLRRAPRPREILDEIYKNADPIEHAILRHDNLFRGKIHRTGGMNVVPLQRFACQQFFAGLYVLSTGEVLPCREDYDGTTVLGTVREGITKIWMKDQAVELSLLHIKGAWKDSELCRDCDEWYYGFQ